MAKELIERKVGDRSAQERDDEISMFAVANILLRSRRQIGMLTVAGLVIGLLIGLLSPRVYTSTATFIPQASEQATSGLALAASQFGITMPKGSGGWGTAVYAELLRSRALLEPLVVDTIPVAEDGGRRTPVMKLFGVGDGPRLKQIDAGYRALAKHVRAEEVQNLGAVTLSVTTKWPSVSFLLADRLVSGVGKFNVERRRSQAAAERQFVDLQSAEAERALRNAEDGLQSFLQRNRDFGGSPQLIFEKDRLQRELSLRQQVYTSLLQNREEARIREVRDTPVITVLEDPKVPVVPESRKTVLKAMLGALGGFLLGVVIALFGYGLSGPQRARNADAREFVELLGDAVPRLRRRKENPQPTVSR